MPLTPQQRDTSDIIKWLGIVCAIIQIVAGIATVACGGTVLIIGGAVSLCAQIISPGIGRMFSAGMSIVSGIVAIAGMGVGGLPAVILGILGTSSIALGANEIWAGITGDNYIQNITGMSDEMYSAIYLGVTVATALGNAFFAQCFVAGTLVLCRDQDGNRCHKKIEDVALEDLVWAYDEKTDTNDWKPVAELFRNESSCKTTVRIKAEDGKIDEIVSTPGHKYYIPNNKINRNANETPEHASYEGLGDKWVSAKYLKHCDRVLLSDGKYGIVVSVKTENCSPYTTYNLEVADFHTYYVGENGTLVHNAGCGGRGVNDLKPDPNAQGAHSTYRTDATGKVTHYAEWTPNPKNPSGFDLVKRFDGIGGTHTNKITLLKVATPHMHGGIGQYAITGGVRTPLPWELPLGY